MKKNTARFSKRHNCRCYGKTTKKQDPKEEDMALIFSPTTQRKPCFELTGPPSGTGIKREPGVVRHIVRQVESPSRAMLKKLYKIPSDKKLDDTSASLAVEDGAHEHATACIDLESAKVREGELAKTLSPARQQSVDSCSEPRLLYLTNGETRLQKAQCGFPEPPCQRGTFFTCADRSIPQARFAHGCGGKDDEVIPGNGRLRRRLHSDRVYCVSNAQAAKIRGKKKVKLVRKDTAQALWSSSVLAKRCVRGNIAPKKKALGELPKQQLTPEKVDVVADSLELLTCLELASRWVQQMPEKAPGATSVRSLVHLVTDVVPALPREFNCIVLNISVGARSRRRISRSHFRVANSASSDFLRSHRRA
ncbi:hypothetical protein HPB50_028348 [Hyalomma asiaticum]|nr:hypothetical protein HPB50_028348 [Hyalomma asiaticum]